MPGDSRVTPLPAEQFGAVTHLLYDVDDQDLRFRIRRLAEDLYGAGYHHGYVNGGQEVRLDATQQRDVELRAATAAKQKEAGDGA